MALAFMVLRKRLVPLYLLPETLPVTPCTRRKLVFHPLLAIALLAEEALRSLTMAVLLPPNFVKMPWPETPSPRIRRQQVWAVNRPHQFQVFHNHSPSREYRAVCHREL